MDRAALDRPRPHQRHLHGEVVEVLGQRARQHLHLRPALDLEDARSSRPAGSPRRSPRRRSGSARGRSARRAPARSRRRSARPPRASRAPAGRSSGSPRRRRSPCPTGRSAAPPSPPAAPGRCRPAAGREHHPARVLGGVARQAPAPRAPAAASARQRPERAPRRADRQLACRAADRLGAVVHVDGARDPLDLARRQPQHLAEVAHRAARAVAGEGGDQRRALGAVALVDPRDQLLADVAREVEVDVGRLGDLLVQEAARGRARCAPGRCARARSGSRRPS